MYVIVIFDNNFMKSLQMGLLLQNCKVNSLWYDIHVHVHKYLQWYLQTIIYIVQNVTQNVHVCHAHTCTGIKPGPVVLQAIQGECRTPGRIWLLI